MRRLKDEGTSLCRLILSEIIELKQATALSRASRKHYYAQSLYCIVQYENNITFKPLKTNLALYLNNSIQH